MKKDINKKIIIGFSIGDYNSIGPEIFLKSFSSTNLFKNCIPIIFCEESILDYYKKKFKINIKIKALEDFDSIKDQKCIYTFSSKRKEKSLSIGCKLLKTRASLVIFFFFGKGILSR